MNRYISLLIFIFVAGSILRFTNLNWDSFGAFHPDERNIAWAVTRIRFFDQMNPKFFAYGGLPIYFYRALAEVTATATNNPDWLTNWGHINILGRLVSAILSSLSILLIFEVGSLYFNAGVGLLSAFLLAFSPWAIREAHFATTETMLVFFLLLLLRQSYHLLKQPSPTAAAKAGTILGLALAAKTTSLLFAVIPLTAIWLLIFDKSRLKLKNVKEIAFSLLGLPSLLVLVSFAVFLLTSPYTLLDLPHFLESMRYETGVTLGRFTVPYTLQFVKTTPYLYQLQTMLWQAGPVALLGTIGLVILLGKQFLRFARLARGGIFGVLNRRRGEVCVFGVPFAKRLRVNAIVLRLALRSEATKGGLHKTHTERKRRPETCLVFLSFPVIYGLWAGSWFAKFSRYNVPFLPFATIAASWLVVKLLIAPKKSSLPVFICRIGLLVGLVGLSSWWGLANWAIYLRPQTRISTSQWIYEHIPAKTTIYTEHWNDGLPIAIPGQEAVPYNRELLTIYDADNAGKLAYYVKKLQQGNFIILSTRRMWAVLPNLSDKYPLTSRFYHQLLAGSLGYQEVATFTSYPSLFGIFVNDDAAEESIQVFDHPTVRIFQNVEKLSGAEIKERLSGT